MAANSGEFIGAVDKGAKKELDNLIKGVEDLVKGVNNANNAFKNISVPSDAKAFISDLNSLLKQNNILLTQQYELQKKLTVETNNGATARAKNNQRTQEEITNTRLLAANAARAAQANSTFASSYEKLSAQANIAGRAVQNIIARGQAGTQTQSQYNAELKKAQSEFSRLNDRVLLADKAIGRYNRNVGNYPTQAIKGLKDLIGAFGIVGGITAFAAITKDIFETTKQLQSLDFALKKVSGSNEAFAESQAFLQRISEAYGIEIQGLTKSYTGFLAASRNAIDAGKITATQINEIFESVSKASGAMGLSVEQQQGAFLALQQMISKGNVQAEEIRGQLAERLPGAFGILAKSMGVTEQQLNKLLKDGKVLAAEVLPAFARELEKAYGVDMLDRVETLTSETVRLSNAWTGFIREISEGDSVITKFFISTVNGIKGALQGLTELTKTEEERRKDLENSIEENAYKTELDYIKQIAAAEGERNAIERANDRIDQYGDRVKQQYAERQEIYKTIEALEKQIELEKDPIFGIKDNTTGAVQNLEKQKELLESNFQLGRLYTGQLRAAQEFLKKEPTVNKVDDGKAKRQKADIDYLREIYQLRKQYTENEIEANERVMSNEEVNYSKRIEAANNYYLLKEIQLKHDLDESIRLNNLEAKNQTEQYATAIKEGKASSDNLTQIEYKRFQKEERLNAEYIGRKNAFTIEAAKKLQGVLDSIQDQSAQNKLSQQGVDDLRQAGLLLGNVSGETTMKQFAELENRMRDLSNAEEDRQVEGLNIQLRRVQAEKDRIKSEQGSVVNNKAIGDLTKEELALQTQILGITNARKEAVASLSKDMKQATTEYLNTFNQGFFSDAGLGSLGKMFDKTTYQIVNDLGEIETKTGSTFQKLFDQAGTAQEKFAVAFTAISEVVQEAFAFITQNQQKAFDAQYAALDKEYALRKQFANGNADAEAELERQLAEKKREIRIREAKATRDTAIFNAIINTAQAVVAALPNVVLAAVIGTIGAAQIALISAQQIPQYAEGTDNHKGGLAIVGDGGRHEVIRTPDGKMSITPDTPTMMNLARGTKVYPDIMSSGLLGHSPLSIPANGNMDALISEVQRLGGKLDGAASFNVTLNKDGFGHYVNNGHNRSTSHNNRVSFKGKTLR